MIILLVALFGTTAFLWAFLALYQTLPAILALYNKLLALFGASVSSHLVALFGATAFL